LPGTTRVSRYQKKHSPTHIFHLLRSIASSLVNLRAWQSFCTTSLQVLFGLPLAMVCIPSPHTPYISSPNQCLLFATHAYTIAACFPVVPRLYHLFLVSLSLNSLLRTISFTLTSHIHLTSLISTHWSATSFLQRAQRSHCKRCISYGNSVCLSVRHTPVLRQNDGT